MIYRYFFINELNFYLIKELSSKLIVFNDISPKLGSPLNTSLTFPQNWGIKLKFYIDQRILIKFYFKIADKSLGWG